MASDTTTAAAAPEEAEVVEEYESDPDEVKRSLVMRRREASDDEEEEQRESERQRNRRVHIHSEDESDSQGGAPADYADEEEEDEGELEEEDEVGDVYEDEEEEEGYEGEERNAGKVKVKGMEGTDGGRSTEGVVGLNTGNNGNGNEDEKNDVVEEEGMEEEKKESNEPFAVPTAGAFFMHDDRFRDNVGGRNRRTHGGRKLWESKDERKWGHDKFEEMTVQSRHYEERRRTSRGCYRGHGKNRGPDQAYPRGNSSRAFNNNNNNQNQAPKGVRGRGPRKYEPSWKNSNQAPQPQNKQFTRSGKPLEKTSYTNSGRAFTPMSNSETVTAPTRKLVFASSLSSASPPFYPGSSNKDITLPQKKYVQSGSTSRKLQNSGIDESFSMQHANAMHRGKNIADVSMDKLYVGDSSASSAVKPLNSLQMPPSQSRALGRGVAVPQQITYQPAAPHNKANRASSTKLQAVQRSPSQSRIQTPAQSTTQQLGQRSASGSQASSPKAASAINSNEFGEVDSSSESSKLKSALLGKGNGSQGRGSFLYGGAPVLGAAGNMSVGHGDQNFPAFLPVMQFGGQHPGGIPAVGMAFPGYVGQPQLGVGNSEMTWLPVLAGAAGALGATYCPPYIAVDGAYNARPTGQTSGMDSSSKESNTNKPGNEWKPSQRPESGSDEYVQQQDKPQPRRYSAMNLANDVLR